jgi:hypothetical protein
MAIRVFGRSLPPSLGIELLRPALIAAIEVQQLPLRTWETAFYSDPANPTRELAVMLSGFSKPSIPTGGGILQCRRVFV